MSQRAQWRQRDGADSAEPPAAAEPPALVSISISIAVPVFLHVCVSIHASSDRMCSSAMMRGEWAGGGSGGSGRSGARWSMEWALRVASASIGSRRISDRSVTRSHRSPDDHQQHQYEFVSLKCTTHPNRAKTRTTQRTCTQTMGHRLCAIMAAGRADCMRRRQLLSHDHDQHQSASAAKRLFSCACYKSARGSQVRLNSSRSGRVRCSAWQAIAFHGQCRQNDRTDLDSL